MDVAPPKYLIAPGLRVDLEAGRLWKDGEELFLGRKAFGLLAALMEQPKSLVPKSLLFEKVWNGVTVSDSVLTTAVKELRQALMDDARNPSIVETVHGRGYRFLLDVERSEAPLGSAGADRRGQKRRFILAAVALIAALLTLVAGLEWRGNQPPEELPPHPRSIVVLPFADLSPNHDQAWFANGLTAEITGSLVRMPDLKIVTEGVDDLTPASDPKRVGEQLHAAHVLVGSVQRNGDHVRAIAQLVRTSDGTFIWSQSFDRRGKSAIEIQGEIASAIARELRPVTKNSDFPSEVDVASGDE